MIAGNAYGSRRFEMAFSDIKSLRTQATDHYNAGILELSIFLLGINLVVGFVYSLLRLTKTLRIGGNQLLWIFNCVVHLGTAVDSQYFLVTAWTFGGSCCCEISNHTPASSEFL